MDCVYQLLDQFPRVFEYNEHFLITIIDECYSCRYGTFLFDCEKDRKEAGVREKTESLWSYINSDVRQYTNPLFEPATEVLYPTASTRRLRLWEAYHCRYTPEFKQHTTAAYHSRMLLFQYQQKIQQLEETLSKKT